MILGWGNVRKSKHSLMNSKTSLSDVNQQLKKMRLNGQAIDLDKYLDSFKFNKKAVASLKWLNNPIWWSRIENKSCIRCQPWKAKRGLVVRDRRR